MDFDYTRIKEMAKEERVSVKDYLVLSPNNDPFYVGSKGQMEKADWFDDVYSLMDRPRECHIRRVHYWLVSQKPRYRKPDGSEYLNTPNDWGFLTMAAKYARYAELIPIENIVDRRNPPAIENATSWEDETPTEIKDGIDAEDIISDIVQKFLCWNTHNTQEYLMEMWAEKSTMNDVLKPIAGSYGMNLVTGLGELSITAVHLLIERVKEINKPTRIFYISDFDPAGECMPVSVSRKIEYFIRQSNLDLDIKLIQVMLTSEQCIDYDLPRTPIKATEARREGFEERHGTGATELDALEALHPGEMKKIIETEVMKYFDPEPWNVVTLKNREVKKKVKEFLEDKITNVLEDIDLSEFDKYEPPKAEQVDDQAEDWIYESDLDYFDQLESYKRFKGQ